jgi:predicted RNase H-like HicB family nuclease
MIYTLHSRRASANRRSYRRRSKPMQYTYTVIVERSDNNYGAWAPDLPGCITTGATVEETLANMREAIELHLEGMREDGDPIPEPSATAAVIQVAA